MLIPFTRLGVHHIQQYKVLKFIGEMVFEKEGT